MNILFFIIVGLIFLAGIISNIESRDDNNIIKKERRKFTLKILGIEIKGEIQ